MIHKQVFILNIRIHSYNDHTRISSPSNFFCKMKDITQGLMISHLLCSSYK